MLRITSTCVIFFSILHHFCSCNYTEKLMQLKIIPEIIPVAPTHKCRIAYKVGGVRKEIESGEPVSDTDIEIRPKFKWPISEDKFYTLYMTGISFVDRRKFQEDFEELGNIETRNPIITRQRECWTVINIRGNKIESGDEIFAYKPTQIDMFNVTEYLIFLVYEQDQKFIRKGARDDYPRCPNVRRLVSKYQLGEPWAGNFFTILT